MKKIKILATFLLAAVGLFLNTSLRAADNAALMAPVKSVYDHYLKIQASLANDSLDGVGQNADAIVKAVQDDPMKMLPPQVATQARTLAEAKDLTAARGAFKLLSASLIKYLANNKVTNSGYHEAYCPMVKAGWLQTGKDIMNPYMGKEDQTCGVMKN